MARNPNNPNTKAQGPTNGYRVTPQRTDNFVDALRRGYVDLKFHSNGRTNESSLELDRPNFFNGNRWGYDRVNQGPTVKLDQEGTVKDFGGRDPLHFHLKDGVANASPEDIVQLHKRVMQNGDDNTMSVTDNHGNIAIFGRPDTLLKRGFSADQFMDYEDERGVRAKFGEQKNIGAGYIPFKKVLVPHR